MSIRKTLNNKLHDIRTGIGDQIEELKAEIDRRFGSLGRKSGDEILRALPEPNGMTMPLMEALEERESERSFSNEPLPDQLVSNLLFAADGINRKGGKRTTPTALNWRETDIYLLKANGIWRWVPERRALLFCALHDIREESYLLNSQFTLPPLELVYVTNYSRTRSFITDAVETIAPKIRSAAFSEEAIRELRIRSTNIDVGAKIQSVYLAAAAMGLSCVARRGCGGRPVGGLPREVDSRPHQVIRALTEHLPLSSYRRSAFHAAAIFFSRSALCY